jgi:hypothetical protein
MAAGAKERAILVERGADRIKRRSLWSRSAKRAAFPAGNNEDRPMTRAATRKDHPLSMRLPEADIVIIDRAPSCAAIRERHSCAIQRRARSRRR